MKQIVIRKKNKVVSVIQSINVMHLLLTQSPQCIKLVHNKAGFYGKSWTKADAYQSLDKDHEMTLKNDVKRYHWVKEQLMHFSFNKYGHKPKTLTVWISCF